MSLWPRVLPAPLTAPVGSGLTLISQTFLFPMPAPPTLSPRHWAGVRGHRGLSEHLLHHHPGLGPLLPVQLLHLRAALDHLRPLLEHRYLLGWAWDGAAGDGPTVTRLPAKPAPSQDVGTAGGHSAGQPWRVTQPTALTTDSPVGLWVITGCQVLTAPTVHPLSQCLPWAYCAPDPGDQRVGPAGPPSLGSAVPQGG